MKNYKLANNILGWVVFTIAATVYLMTIEPTASFWDCGEFIASAHKLEVGHPPGNPIFMLVANLFTQMASDVSKIPLMVNAMSAIFSALTILFLFWTITHLARKIVLKDENVTKIKTAQQITILGAGLVGSLVYTFSDTFWFSAVEGEVYAFSSLMTALVFWLILKWEDVADQPHSNRWLILIAYLMGISIAVHLLNLLCIPAIVLVYYFKKTPNPNLKGSLKALAVSFGLIVALLYGLIQGLVEVCGWFELFFVNQLRMPYNSGVVAYIVLVAGILGWSIWETMREKQQSLRVKISFILAVTLLGIPFIGSEYFLGIFLIAALTGFLFYYKKINPVALNTILISLFVITIGYSSYALILIRSTANTPMDQNSPEDIFTLRGYLSREQYGDTPLFYGQTYASVMQRVVKGNICELQMKDDGPVWSQAIKKNKEEKDHYFISDRKKSVVYEDKLNTVFPRMYSQDSRHIEAYKEWANIKGESVTIQECGESRVVTKPTFAENLRYFFSYQVNFMYWRYFMWNFSGRQNDIQGHGEVSNGNWITGINFIDEALVGPQDNMPYDIAQNKGHNKYYMLPFLLGMLGLLFQAYSGNKGIQGFWVTFMLFFMTGLAIVVYLNQSPNQPRERDYAYAGSFFAFSIWIGLGVVGLVRILTKYAKITGTPASIAVSVLCLLIPIQMASQNWDDHSRAGRFVARDFGYNYLTTCAPNAIIFTMGDNDTFPLWYAQEVEGYRTDVRVCNLSYLRTDWYIDQMKRQAYESTPLPISWKKSDYIQGTHEDAVILNKTDKPIDLGMALEWIKSDDARYKQTPYGRDMDNIPSTKVSLKIDSAAVVRAGIIRPDSAHWLPKEMIIDFGGDEAQNIQPKSALYKHEMIILDMLKNNTDWSRPFYYAATVSPDEFLHLDPYFRQEGVAFRIVPFNTRLSNQMVNTDAMFDNMMNKYKWGGIDKSNLYLDENTSKMARTFRMMFNSLGEALIHEGKKDKAEQVINYNEKVIPSAAVPYDYTALGIAENYLKLGKKDKAVEVYEKIADYSMKNLNWYARLKPEHFRSVMGDVRMNISVMSSVLRVYQEIDPKLGEKYYKQYEIVFNRYQSLQKSTLSGGLNR